MSDGRSDRRRSKSFAQKLRQPNAERLWYVGDAYRLGMTIDEIYQLSAIDPWFLEKIREIDRRLDGRLPSASGNPAQLDADILRSWKQIGFADARIAKLTWRRRS